MEARLPAPLIIKGNISENFKTFRQNFEIYMVASGKEEKADKIKVATLLNLIGEEGVKVFNTLKLNDTEKQDYDKVLSEIETFFCQKKNVVYERFLFYSRKQRNGEAFDHFLTDVKTLAASCEFAEPENMIRDIIILGVYSKILQEQLLRVDKLDMHKAIKICKGNESSERQMEEMQVEDLKTDNITEKPGQWAPDRLEGKKQYERDFLLALKNHPASRQKPDNIPDNVLRDEQNALVDEPLGSSQLFENWGKGASGSKNVQPSVTTSTKIYPALDNMDMDGRPTKIQTDETDDEKSASLYKRVRSVLNKLTPQKFDTLVNQVRQLKIDTKERLQGVIDLVFDQAITDKLNFSVLYAKMCKELQIMQVNAGQDKKSVAFRTLLVTRCQVEFEKQCVDETDRNRKVKIINECTDPEKKKKFSFELEEYDRRLRMKSLGCIRFIGELFNQKMMTTSIMLRCLQTLINKNDEESLECLCKLLTTVGKELETKNMNLSGIFDEIKRIIDGKKQKVSSRIRFMLQDVTELRDSKWIPIRKTMDQIQKEVQSEYFKVKEMNMNSPPKDYLGMERMLGFGRKMRAAKRPVVDEPLGSSSLFGNWGKGAVIVPIMSSL